MLNNGSLHDIIIVNLDHGKIHLASKVTKKCNLEEMGEKNHHVVPVNDEIEFKHELASLERSGRSTCKNCFPPKRTVEELCALIKNSRR